MGGDTCDHQAIMTAFANRNWVVRTSAVVDAYHDPHGDALLAEMLDRSTEPIAEKPFIAAHLGDLHGDDGVAALERATEASGRGSRNIRCVALLALAKRCGEQATERLREGLAASDGSVKDYAVIALAGAGDDRAWEDVFKRLGELLRRRSRRAEDPSEVAAALAYLSQHVEDADRRTRLVEFIRRRSAAIAEDDWLREFWPDAMPDGPPIRAVEAPESSAIRAWVRDPLFNPLGPPYASVDAP